MFQVFEGVKGHKTIKDYEHPCDVTGFPWAKAECWANSKFATWAEAVRYANDWLGDSYAPFTMVAGRPYFYCCKNYIVIKEVL